MSFSANANRAVSADTALVAYMFRTSCDCEDCLVYLLRDLMHWADKAGLNFNEAFWSARCHYNAQHLREEVAA